MDNAGQHYGSSVVGSPVAQLTPVTGAHGVEDPAMEREIDHYRDLLAAVVLHHCQTESGEHAACCCGQAWPCQDEQRAAQLLDLF